MTTENNTTSNTPNNSGNNETVDLQKPQDASGNVTMQIAATPEVEKFSVPVNVGFPGKLKKVLVDSDSTVSHVLKVAELNPQGYEVRMQGQLTRLDARIPEGVSNLLIVLVKPVKGNSK